MSSASLHADQTSLTEINAMSEDDFVARIGPIFENSPWIARATWPQRPFASREDLRARLSRTVRQSPLETKVELIQAHPDLAGRLARQGQLTAASTDEQASAGLDRLSADEMALFHDYNERYKAKFGFPFVICAKLNDKRTILLAFRRRLELTRGEEIDTALDEIEKIAALRLSQIVLA
jgi:OHCU decarboxylase